MRHAGEHMPPPEQSRAEGHEVRDAVFAISDQFVKYIRYQCQCFCVVQSHPASQAFLGEEAGLGDDELVDLDFKSAIEWCVRVGSAFADLLGRQLHFGDLLVSSFTAFRNH